MRLPIFVYGTLMQGYAGYASFFGALSVRVRPAAVRGRLVHLPEGYPALLPGDGRVRGELIELPGADPDRYDALLAALDDYEGYLEPQNPENLYERRILSVAVDGDDVLAYGYVYARAEYAVRAGVPVPGGDWRAFMRRRERPAPQVLVDADACPQGAMAVLRRLQSEYGFRLVTVSSFHHAVHGAEHITVGDAPDETDYAIVGRAAPGDIVVTRDRGLAALAIAKHAWALSPEGLLFTEANIAFLLDERHHGAKARRAGIRLPGPKARTREDDRRFEAALRRLLAETEPPASPA